MAVRNNFEKLGALWLTRYKETSQGGYLETNLMRLPWNVGSRIVLDRDRIDDRDKMNGYEGPTQIIEAQRKASASLSLDMATPDFIAFIMAFFYGSCESTLDGEVAYQHQITASSDITAPTFSGYQQHGDGIYSEKFAGLAINSFSIEIGSPWIKASCNILGLGKSSVDYVKATGTLSSATTLDFPPASAGYDGHIRSMPEVYPYPSGDTEAERINNIYRFRIKSAEDGLWYPVTVSGCTVEEFGPSGITFDWNEADGHELNGDEEFEIFYLSATADSWKSLRPDINQESPLKLVQASLLINGADSLINLDWYGLTIMGENNLVVENLPGSGTIYASRIMRGQRILTFKLSQQARDCLLAADIDNNDTLSLDLTVTGAPFQNGQTTTNYSFTLNVPLVGILKHDFESNGKLLGQRGDLIALHDPDSGIGTVEIVNKIPSYAILPVNQRIGIAFEGIATAGYWHIALGEETSSEILLNQIPYSVEMELEIFDSIQDVTVTGNMADGLIIEFTGLDAGKSFALPTVDISDLSGVTDVTIAELPSDDGPINQKQKITFTGTAASGHWHITLGEETTSIIAYNTLANLVSAALEVFDSIQDVFVTGNMTTGFTIEFTGDDAGKNFDLFTVDISALVGVTEVTIEMIQQGRCW